MLMRFKFDNFLFLVLHFLMILSYDVASGSEITPCNKIN